MEIGLIDTGNPYGLRKFNTMDIFIYKTHKLNLLIYDSRNLQKHDTGKHEIF